MPLKTAKPCISIRQTPSAYVITYYPVVNLRKVAQPPIRAPLDDPLEFVRVVDAYIAKVKARFATQRSV